MRQPILKSLIDVGNRLDELGTAREYIFEVVSAVVAARSECTDNDPSGTRGYRGWQMGTRRNRELHCALDNWEKDDSDQIASIVNRALGVKIIVCNTDEGTCVDNATPQNRSKKGAATERLVDRNQFSFIDQLDTPHRDSKIVALKQPIRPTLVSYYLCVYHEGEDIRCELSCAVETSDGYFSSFSERIFIIGGEAGGGETVRRKKPSDDGSDFDIPVKRKKT